MHWHGEETTERELGEAGGRETDEGRVRYLSQQFVERLCASDGLSDELLTEIERVIYNAWPVDERQGAVDFRELLEIRLSAARERQATEREAIARFSDEIAHQRLLWGSLARRREQLRMLELSARTLSDQITALTVQAGSVNAERYAVVSDALAARQEALQTVDRRITALTTLRGAAETAESNAFPDYLRRLQSKHPEAQLSEKQWLVFLPRFSGDVPATLATAISEARAAHAEILGQPPAGGTGEALDSLEADKLAGLTVSTLKAEQARLHQLVGLDAERAKQLRRLQQQAGETRTRITRLKSGVAEAEGAQARINELVPQRADRYEAYFNAILEEQQQLEELYAPLRNVLDALGGSVARLRFAVRRRVDLAGWAADGERLIDLRTGTFRGSGELERIAREMLLEAWQTDDANRARQAVQEFADRYSESLREQSLVSREDEAAYREWERQVSRWLYSVAHIEVLYSLEYDGLDVTRLSPGTRGIVLLLLYLAVDQAETDPLIIDQPEENLDPESVYSELVALFRSASQRRQIIMVTHNANLVVNTDVDQVIVARRGRLEEGRLPELHYLAGGLEDPTVRTNVCDVLEGGEEAFRQRARRLHIDAPAATAPDQRRTE